MMRPNGIVTFLSDFGLADGYVAAVKGVLLGLSPSSTRIIDVSHLVARHDVEAGALVLASVARYFPVGTVHLAVVDPGVGSDRRAVAVQGESAWFVGPDNGLLDRALVGQEIRVVGLDPARVTPGRDPSPTFHGRDLFGPAAARLLVGSDLEELGDRLDGLVPLADREPVRSGSRVVGRVVSVDSFGNLVTNIGRAIFDRLLGELVVEVDGRRIGRLVRTYADVEVGQLCALIGSDDTLEVSVREGSAARELSLGRGAQVLCRPDDAREPDE